MRKLNSNEKIVKEYERFILIEVACPEGKSYRTTIDKWEQADTPVLKGHNPDEKFAKNYWKWF